MPRSLVIKRKTYAPYLSSEIRFKVIRISKNRNSLAVDGRSLKGESSVSRGETEFDEITLSNCVKRNFQKAKLFPNSTSMRQALDGWIIDYRDSYFQSVFKERSIIFFELKIIRKWRSTRCNANRIRFRFRCPFSALRVPSEIMPQHEENLIS